MVLNRRFILPIFLCTFCLANVSALPNRSQDKRIFDEAKNAYKNNNYETVITLLNRRFNLKDPKTPTGALSLAGFAYEKLGQYGNAKKIYQYLLKNRYRTMNKKIVGAFKSGTLENFEDAPKSVLEIYHRLAETLSQLYTNNYDSLNPRLRELYKKNALTYVSILEETEYEDDSYDVIPERFEKFQQEVQAKTYRTGWFVQSSYVSWRDKLDLLYPNGDKASIDSTGEGTCVGGGWRYENDYFEYNINGCYAIASMTAGKENSTISYFQQGVRSTALMVGPSILWKPKSKGAGFGVHLPIVYRTGDYTEPTSFTLEDTTIFTYGYLLQADWRFEKLGVFTKFGKISRFSSSFWSLGAMYSF